MHSARAFAPKPRYKVAFDLVFIEGPDDLVFPLFAECGGHRWQHVPPTDHRGRVHTSTVTVAVFEMLPEKTWRLSERDIEILISKGTGPGGQNRNKRETAVVIRHKPTGIEVKAEAERGQIDNKRVARATLEFRVSTFHASQHKAAQDSAREGMVGSGQRGDKARTYREQNNQVTDHRTGRKARLSDIRAGRLELLR